MATRKTNVRQHARKTSASPTTVTHHQRNIKVKPTLGYVKLKDLNYPQAKKRYPTLEPNGDVDGDGVVNSKDCHPFDIKRQDDPDWKGYEEDKAIDESDNENLTSGQIEMREAETRRRNGIIPYFGDLDYKEQPDDISNYEYEQRRESAGLKRKGDVW